MMMVMVVMADTQHLATTWASLVAQMVKTACNVGDSGLISGSGRFLGEGKGYPLQYSCPENPLDRGACELQSMGWQRVRHD